MEEIWKDICGYEGHYQISNLGKVKSFMAQGGFPREKIRINSFDGRYLYVSLYENGKSKNHTIHRLIAIHFIKNPDNKRTVNHINGIKTDNRIENLEWCTRSENMKHAHLTLLINNNLKGKKGILNPSSKKIKQYTLEGLFIKTWDSGMDIQRELGIRQNNISACCNGVYKSTGGFIFKF